MKRILYITTMLLTLSLTGIAQIKDSTAFTQTIKGIITDRATGLGMPGVTIKVTSINPIKTTLTDANGAFKISGVNVGRHVLEASYIGYQTVSLSEVLVVTGKEAEANIDLELQKKQLNEVVVNATSGRRPINTMATTSSRSFSPEETNRYAGGFFDPARMAQSFAGVVAGGDNNEIVVRGNSPKSLQWRLEGIEIINPNHFSNEGAAGGNISMLNSSILGTSDFYTGALPAEYNNATSGVFDLKFRKGNTSKREYSFSLGILGAGATLEGPFKKGGSASYLISYRYSSLGLLQQAGLLGESSVVPKYQDLSFNFVFPTKGAGTFSLFGIGGISNIDSKAKRDIKEWDERDDASDFNVKYGAGSVGLKHVFTASPKLFFSNIVSYNTDRSHGSVDTLTQAFAPTLTQKSKYQNSAIRYAGTMNLLTGSSNHIRAGVNAGLLTYDLYALQYKKENQQLQQLLNQKGNAQTFDAYVENKHDFDNGLTLNTGVHANYFNLSKSWSIESRAGLSYKLPANQQLSLAAGTYSRLESLSYYFAGNGTGNSSQLAPTKSAQIVAGYEKLFNSKLKFKTEVYYQHLYDVPVSIDPANNFSLLNVLDNTNIGSSNFTQLVNKGTGKNYGIELSLEKSLSKGYYFIVTTSLFDSKFKALSGKEFNTAFNSRFAGNLVIGKEWAVSRDKKNLLGLNAKVIYAGGRKYSPINLAESLRLDEQVIDQSQVNTLTADDYIRVDYSASYRINGKKASHHILLDIQNVLNKENNIGLFYNPSKKIIEKQKWLGIIPALTYRIEF